MRDSVRKVFVTFSAPMEGIVDFLYPDVKNLVSIGMGNLVDPIDLALSLPLVHFDGTPATQAEIADEWHRIKNLPPNAKGQTAAMLGHLYAKPFTTLRLTPEGLDIVVGRKLDEMDAYLAHRFPDYPSWPADAQLATLSMSWACGPGFHFPKLEAALRTRDFRTAAVECFMPEEKTISGLRPRNKANRLLYTNAAIATECGDDPDTLFWPNDRSAAVVDDDNRIVHPLDLSWKPVS